ncbi:hypothetical protein [Chitinivorax sp. B]|uniref:hypothetical protein n=1 Tax=Chitinivorax sp. B TaxID=2502235 RepID=UPI0010F89DAD|nr:hypothetical protein [Chitinivorax sp. B]
MKSTIVYGILKRNLSDCVSGESFKPKKTSYPLWVKDCGEGSVLLGFKVDSKYSFDEVSGGRFSMTLLKCKGEEVSPDDYLTAKSMSDILDGDKVLEFLKIKNAIIDKLIISSRNSGFPEDAIDAWCNTLNRERLDAEVSYEFPYLDSMDVESWSLFLSENFSSMLKRL